MKSFSNKRTRRNTAFAALLVWLFALSSGVANACLLEAPTQHSHPHSRSHTHGDSHVAEAGSGLHHRHGGVTEHSVAVASDEHDPDVPKDACLKVCDDGSKAPVKLQASSDLLDPGMPPVVTIVWDPATPVACAPSEMDDLQPPVAGPPFRVRYSRLAL